MAYVIKNGVIHYVGKSVQAPEPAKVEQPKKKTTKRSKKQ